MLRARHVGHGGTDMRHIIAVLVIATLAGCASVPTPTPVSVDDVKALTGTWQGWLVTERGFNLINFEIRADGSFEVTGLWRGTLVPEGTGERRALRLERDDRLYRGTLHPFSHAG